MDDASPVRRRERFGQLDRKVEEGWEWKSAGLDECLERLPFHELHGEEADAGVLLDRVGMIEEGDRARLALEARESARVLGHMLYIGGDFTSVAGVARNHISRLSFNGAALSLTLYDPSATNGTVNALQVYDNYLYAGGSFLNVKGFAQPYFAGIYQYLTAVETSSPPAVGVMAVTASPNPFGERTAIRFTLDAPAPTRILLIDAHGRVVRRLHDGFLPAGRHAIAWNGRDDGQRAVGSGVYFAEVLAGGRRSVSKVFHLK